MSCLCGGMHRTGVGGLEDFELRGFFMVHLEAHLFFLENVDVPVCINFHAGIASRPVSGLNFTVVGLIGKRLIRAVVEFEGHYFEAAGAFPPTAFA